MRTQEKHISKPVKTHHTADIFSNIPKVYAASFFELAGYTNCCSLAKAAATFSKAAAVFSKTVPNQQAGPRGVFSRLKPFPKLNFICVAFIHVLHGSGQEEVD